MASENQHWKQSLWTKLIAACFIGLILLGNIWLVLAFSAKVPPVWLQTCFVSLAGAVFVFGAALGAEQLMRKISETDARQTAREDGDQDTP